MTPALLLVVGIAAVAAALLVLALVVLPAGPGRVPLSRLDPTVVPPASALSGAGAAAGAAVEKMLVKRGRVASGVAALEKAGLSTSLPDFVLTVGLVAIGAGAVGIVVGGLLVGLLLAAAVPLLAKLLLRFLARRRQSAFADQLDDSLQLMASSLRAGHSLLRAVDSVSQEADAPTSEEFARIVNETRVDQREQRSDHASDRRLLVARRQHQAHGVPARRLRCEQFLDGPVGGRAGPHRSVTGRARPRARSAPRRA